MINTMSKKSVITLLLGFVLAFLAYEAAIRTSGGAKSSNLSTTCAINRVKKDCIDTDKLTFAMIKPDAVRAKNTGKIIDIIEKNGFIIAQMHKITIDQAMAEQFYAVHKNKPFFKELVSFITSGPVIVMALQKRDAVKSWRDLMGSTDPKKAAPGTIRQLFGAHIGSNAVHGSDAQETAMSELSLFFGVIDGDCDGDEKSEA